MSDTSSEGSGFESEDDVPLSRLDRTNLHESDGESIDSDGETIAELQPRWKSELSNVVKNGFCGPQPGPTVALDCDKNELDFMQLFFPDDLMDHIIVETNRYASDKQKNKTGKIEPPFTKSELYAYFGIRTYMSIVNIQKSDTYWSNDCVFGQFYISKILPRDRYDRLTQYLHINDNSKNPPKGTPGHDKLHQFRPVNDVIMKKCLENYHPHQNVSVDEAMVAYRGRLSFRQYIPAKPTKYGIKVWVRADPTNGYVNELQVYTGKENGTAEVGLGARVVMDLTKSIQHKHHIINCDNFFSSPTLFMQLLSSGIYARGTVRQNRKDFPAITLGKLKNRGSSKVVQRGELLAITWMDKKQIYLLSTSEDPSSIETTITRKDKNGTHHQVPCPKTIPEYNNSMNGVDRADQLRSQFHTARTSRKWWHYLFWFSFDVAVANSFIMMRESQNHVLKTKSGRIRPLTMLEFRTGLAKAFFSKHRGLRKRSITATLDICGVDSVVHYPIKGKKARCRNCTRNKIRSEPSWVCVGCKVNLCVECFEPYHKFLNIQ